MASALDGRNSSGRKVSLLNTEQAYPAMVSTQSRTSSFVSTRTSVDDTASFQMTPQTSPEYSPRTPQLIRLGSHSSQYTLDPTAPPTPQSTYEATFTPRQSSTSDALGFHPYIIRRTSSYERYPEDLEAKLGRPDLSLHSLDRPRALYEEAVSSPEPVSPKAGAAPKSGAKNKYLCPYRKTMNCMITFTTSGHAARHAKVHTGGKNVLCPVCGKAFTRKDNMKQHQRTHENSRGAAGGGRLTEESRVKKAKPSTMRKTRVQSEEIGGRKSQSARGSVGSRNATNALPARGQLQRSSFDGSAYSDCGPSTNEASTGSYYGSPWGGAGDGHASPADALNALALVASGLPLGSEDHHMA